MKIKYSQMNDVIAKFGDFLLLILGPSAQPATLLVDWALVMLGLRVLRYLSIKDISLLLLGPSSQPATLLVD
jgi:hypothetical protein